MRLQHARAEATPSTGSDSAFYRYHDASGRIVIVDSLSRVPAAERASAEALVLTPSADAGLGGAAGALLRELHVPSFIAGAGSALTLALLFFGLSRKLGHVLRGALVLGAVALGAVGYLGWMRRTTGQSGDLLASPGALIDDARAAVDKMNQRSAEQQRVLKELERAR